MYIGRPKLRLTKGPIVLDGFDCKSLVPLPATSHLSLQGRYPDATALRRDIHAVARLDVHAIASLDARLDAQPILAALEPHWNESPK